MRVLLIFIALVFAGCSENSGGSGGNGGGSNEKFEINGVDAKDYYRQFLFSEKETDDGKRFNYVAADTEQVGETLPEKEQKCANFDLALYGDGTFRVNYEESFCIKSSNRPHTWDPVYEKKIFGNWSVNELSLMLEGFAVAKGFRYNGNETLRIYLNENVNREIPEDTFFMGHYQKETVFPFDE